MSHSAFRGFFQRAFGLLDIDNKEDLEGVTPTLIVGDAREPGIARGPQYRRFCWGNGGSTESISAGAVIGFRAFAPCVITSLELGGTQSLGTGLVWRILASGVSVKADNQFTRYAPYIDASQSATDFAPLAVTNVGGSAGADAGGVQFWGMPPLAAMVRYGGEPLFLTKNQTVLVTSTAAVANIWWLVSGYTFDALA